MGNIENTWKQRWGVAATGLLWLAASFCGAVLSAELNDYLLPLATGMTGMSLILLCVVGFKRRHSFILALLLIGLAAAIIFCRTSLLFYADANN